MPVLILARHAKAEPYGETDFLRSLDAKGLAQAVGAGAEIAERWPVDTAIASAARRTVQTGQAVVEALRTPGGNSGPELRQDESLYDCAVADWIDAINSIPSDSTGAYIVGHQPTVAEVIGILCPDFGTPEPFRPSSIAVFTLDSWDVEPGEFPVPEIRYFRGA